MRTLVLALSLAVAAAAQTVSMGRTYVSSLNIRYANEGATGTTLNKLAKLTGAPSTAIITATTDTQGIIGVVVAGAGTTGNAVIAVEGKASCVFDAATTAGHYVIQSTVVNGNCQDSGAATYPTSGQVIGLVTSTNGAGGTYEVDLSIGQPQAAAGGGGALASGPTDPATCTVPELFFNTTVTTLKNCVAANTWESVDGLRTPQLSQWTVSAATATVTDATHGILAVGAPGTVATYYRSYAPSSEPWRAIAGFMFAGGNENLNNVSLCLTQVAANKGYCIEYGWSATRRFVVNKTDAALAFVSNVCTVDITDLLTPRGGPIFVSMYQDATSKYFQLSTDGLGWLDLSACTIGHLVDYQYPDTVWWQIRGGPATWRTAGKLVHFKTE